MGEKYRLLLISEDSPAIRGCEIEGLCYYQDGDPYKAIIQVKKGDFWEDITINQFDYRYATGDVYEGLLYFRFNGKPCIHTI